MLLTPSMASLTATPALMAAVRVPWHMPETPWPDEVRSHFKRAALHEPWLVMPDGLNRRAEFFRYLRARNRGRPIYPRSVEQYRAWEAEWWSHHGYGRCLTAYDNSNGHPLLQWLRIQLQPVEADYSDVWPEQLGFSPVSGESATPGDLVSYSIPFGWSAGIVTKTSYQRDVCEVMLFKSLSLYLTHPANGGGSPRFWRYQPSRYSPIVPTKTRVEDSHSQPKAADWDELAGLADTLDFTSARFAILQRQNYRGSFKGFFETHLKFANLEEVLLQMSTQPANKVQTLHVTIRYLGPSDEGNRQFPILAERALRRSARAGGFSQLQIYYALVLKDSLKEALTRYGYGRHRSPHGMCDWAKRIKLS